MSDTDRNPMEEIGKRAAEVGPGLAAAAKAQGIQQLAAIAADCRQRTLDGHRARMRALGMEDIVGKSEAAPMGDIVVTGDLYGDEAVRRLAQAGTGEVSAKEPLEAVAAPVRTSLAKKALPYLLAAALGASGGSVPWLVAALGKVQPSAQPAEYVDTTTSIGIGGGEPTLEWP